MRSWHRVWLIDEYVRILYTVFMEWVSLFYFWCLYFVVLPRGGWNQRVNRVPWCCHFNVFWCVFNVHRTCVLNSVRIVTEWCLYVHQTIINDIRSYRVLDDYGYVRSYRVLGRLIVFMLIYVAEGDFFVCG